MLLSQFILPYPSPVVSTGLFSMSTSSFLPYKQVHAAQYQKNKHFNNNKKTWQKTQTDISPKKIYR